MYLRRRREMLFTKEYPTPISQEANEWLAYVEESQNIDLIFSRNSTEYRVGNKQRAVDGFCRLIFIIVIPTI